MAKLAGRERLEPVGDEEAHAALEAAARDLLSLRLPRGIPTSLGPVDISRPVLHILA